MVNKVMAIPLDGIKAFVSLFDFNSTAAEPILVPFPSTICPKSNAIDNGVNKTFRTKISHWNHI